MRPKWDNPNLYSDKLIREGWCQPIGSHGPLTRYVKLRVAHAPGMPRMFSPPPTTKETASLRSRAWPTCRDACRDCQPAVAGKTFPGIPGACATRNFTNLIRGPCLRPHWQPSCHQVRTFFLGWIILYFDWNFTKVFPPSGSIKLAIIDSSNGLVPSGNKLLPEAMLTKIYDAIWRRQATLS